MMRRHLVMLGLAFAGFSHAALAGGVTPKEAFERMKQLSGTWEGKEQGEGGAPTKVQYRTTSAGTAVMEVLFPGSDHEMVSIYFIDGGELRMTHYCSMGNQPRLRLDGTASSSTDLRFAFDGGTNFDPKKDQHIHAARIAVPSADRLEEEWIGWKDGKEDTGHRIKMVLSRSGS